MGPTDNDDAEPDDDDNDDDEKADKTFHLRKINTQMREPLIAAGVKTS